MRRPLLAVAYGIGGRPLMSQAPATFPTDVAVGKVARLPLPYSRPHAFGYADSSPDCVADHNGCIDCPGSAVAWSLPSGSKSYPTLRRYGIFLCHTIRQ